jgi:alanine racemase
MGDDRRPTVARIDLEAFAANLETARTLAAPASVMAILKADGYGHGAVRLARVAAAAGCPLIGVATVTEALSLRAAGIDLDILVLGGIPPGSEDTAAAASLSAVVADEGSARRLDRAAGRAGCRLRVHLKIDTGMGRLGFLPSAAAGAARLLLSLGSLETVGVMTHYARADEADPGPTLRQAELFEAALDEIRRAGLAPPLVHARNSAALIRRHGPPYTLARPGIMLYGGCPELDSALDLRPVMTLETAVAQVRTVPDGWPVGYGGRYVARGERRIAVLPVGYADGFLRYNEGGEVLVRGRRAPLAGRVCMDLAMADVTGIEGVEAGDEVVLAGSQGGMNISAGEVAGRGGTISYEFFCGVSARVPRVYSTIPSA